MDQVARKLRKGETLNTAEIEAWIEYNYLALPEDHQEMVQHFISRQKRV